ncbi:PulJ/GspJ family protein [Rhizorhabdus wittichii]|uniref:PulJ/GspJ family protein n=1 Tax=Rhizorhabdus wittichii TaxID=160791 RepID=UPI0009DAFD7E|nr:type II secretion system protein [Rhizorhabdus wittichii]
MTRANGFTLIELLAAMVAGSLLLISLAWATGAIGRETRLSLRERQIEDASALSITFERLVDAALPSQDGRAPFEVSGDQLTGMIAPPAALGTIGPVRMTMDVRRERDGVALYLSLASDDPANTLPRAARSPIKLASGFRSIQFDAVEVGKGGAQQHINLNLAGIEDRTLIAATRVTSTGACRFDAISGVCQ